MSSNPLISAFQDIYTINKQNRLINGLTWNGDINFSSLGNNFESALLALDQKMVLPETARKKGLLSDLPTEIFDNLFNQITAELNNLSDLDKAKGYNLVFRYLFYLRSIRVPGKRSRLLFYYLFGKLYNIYPKTCGELITLIPTFGYFGDLDYIITHFSNQDIIDAVTKAYINALNQDCNTIFGKNIRNVTLDEAKTMNNKLRNMTVPEIRSFVNGKNLSLAAKWFKREGKKNSDYREDIIISIYYPNGGIKDLQLSTQSEARVLATKRLNYSQMLFRNVLSAITQCLLVGEQMMCETDSNHRTWEDIPIENAPAKFITKYRKALANESLNESLDDSDIDTGNRFKNNQDRVNCRQNLLKSLLEGKLKGATQDIDRLSSIIFKSVNNLGSLTITDRKIIATQWNDLVNKLKVEINTIIENNKQESNTIFIDPRNVIPVIDTSGSMCSANIQDKAIGLGLLASHLSSMPGCLISFSDNPEVFYLDLSDKSKSDVFDHFKEIINGPMGYSTNIDATYRLLLDIMVSKKIKSTDFSLLFLTDGQFNAQVSIPDNETIYYPISDRFEKIFIGRMETAFKEKGYNLPRTIFWNLNSSSPGFPASGITRGVQLVSGYSQSLMLQVFTGDYTYEIDPVTNQERISVNPWESFLKAILHEGYDIVSNMVANSKEGCLKYLIKDD